MATTPQALADQGACYNCTGMLSMYEIFKITLLAQIAATANPSADITPQGLMTRAACFQCGSFATPGQLYELALLQIIAGG